MPLNAPTFRSTPIRHIRVRFPTLPTSHMGKRQYAGQIFRPRPLRESSLGWIKMRFLTNSRSTMATPGSRSSPQIGTCNEKCPGFWPGRFSRSYLLRVCMHFAPFVRGSQDAKSQTSIGNDRETASVNDRIGTSTWYSVRGDKLTTQFGV